MNEELGKYLDDLFADTPKDRRVLELKEELFINMNEKYQDLLLQGYSAEDAYKLVISGVGDVEELISGLQPNPLNPKDMQEERKKTALTVSICVGLYVLSFIGLAVFDELGSEILSMVAFFGIAAVSTCILIYHFLSRPKYKREKDTIVEEFKEWRSEDIQKKNVKGALSSVLWTLIVVIYFVVSFSFRNWHISWIIFIIGAILQQVMNLILDQAAPNFTGSHLDENRKKIMNSIISILWTTTLAIYFIISFTLNIWHISWVIFLIAAAATSVIRLLFVLKK